MKKIAILPFIIFCFLLGNLSFAQDGTTSKKKSSAIVATKKTEENKKTPVSTSEPTGLTAPVYTPRPAASVEPKKKLPKTNSTSDPK